MPAQQTETFLHGRRAVLALAALGACAACFITAESLPIGLLPQISASMHRSLSVTGLLVTIYALVVVFATVPLAHLTRKLPRRLLLSAVAGVLVLGCLGSALAPNFWVLLVFRIITALAQAIFWAVGPVEAANLVRPERRGRAVSAVFGGAPSAWSSAFPPARGSGMSPAGDSRSSLLQPRGCSYSWRSSRRYRTGLQHSPEAMRHASPVTSFTA